MASLVAPLAIRLVPDPALRAPCLPVEAFDDALALLARDMLETMYAAPGRGLAAPQVGVGLRLVVMDAGWRDGRPGPRALANPVVTWSSPERAVGEESCLSIPGPAVAVERAAEVALRWRDLDGTAREGRFQGVEARILQHEVDHLDGVLCTDRGTLLTTRRGRLPL